LVFICGHFNNPIIVPITKANRAYIKMMQAYHARGTKNAAAGSLCPDSGETNDAGHGVLSLSAGGGALGSRLEQYVWEDY